MKDTAEGARENAGLERLRRLVLLVSAIAGPLTVFSISEYVTGGYYLRLIASFGQLSFDPFWAGLGALGRKTFTAFVWLPALYIATGLSCFYAVLTALILKPAAWWRARRHASQPEI